ETPGFGAKALEEDFQKQFIGKTFPIALTDIDAIAGATVTSTAVVDAISAAIAAPAVEAEPAAAEPTVLKGTAQGFVGPVVVEVTVDEKNVITAITIGDENFAETVGLGSNVQRESYTSQFIGKTLPLADGDIDAVTGATITSNAVLEAIKVAK
ncbi:MAG: FMN-binding protein, partial [bacterium]|nr:FMN-binding protein [bacterium]